MKTLNVGYNMFNQLEIPTMVVCNPNKDELYTLPLAYNISNKIRYNAFSELDFDYPESKDGGLTTQPEYGKLEGKRLICIKAYDDINDDEYYMIQEAPIDDDGSVPVKHVSAYTLESEMLSIRLTGFTGTYLLSELMNKIILRIPTWSIGTVDSSLTSLYRTFESNNSTVYNFLVEDIEKAYGCVVEFDTSAKTISFVSNVIPDPDSTVFLSLDNVVKQLQFKEITEEICTALYCYGGGDLTIRNVNPLGGTVIYDFGYYKDSEWMTSGLISALGSWESAVSTQQPLYAGYLTTLATHYTTKASLDSELSELEIEMSVLEEELIATEAADGDTDSVEDRITAKQIEITAKASEIFIINNMINSQTATLRGIVHQLYFTNKQSYDDFLTDVQDIADNITDLGSDWTDYYIGGSYTKALLHFNGVNGSTTFTDAGVNTWSAGEGNAVIGTTTSKFGSGCLVVDTFWSGIYTPSTKEFEAGTGDVTISGFVYLTSVVVEQTIEIFGAYTDTDKQAGLVVYESGSDTEQIIFLVEIGGTTTLCSTSLSDKMNINTWYHVAYTRKNGVNRLFLDGVSQTLTVNTLASSTPINLSDTVYLGALIDNGSEVEAIVGIDEVRYAKGICAWDSNFTVPIKEHTLTELDGIQNTTGINAIFNSAVDDLEVLEAYLEAGLTAYPPTTAEETVMKGYITDVVGHLNTAYTQLQQIESYNSFLINVLYNKAWISSFTSIIDARTNNMTYTQYLELTGYIYENTYTNQHIITTDIMTPTEIQAQSQALYDQAETILNTKVSLPRYEFSGSFSNLIAIEIFPDIISKLELGKPIYIRKDEDTVIDAVLLEIAITYDDPTKISMTFGNSYRLDNSHFIYSDLLGNAAKTGTDALTV